MAAAYTEVAKPSLTLLQRILLTTDGTITPILQAYAGEPIRVHKLAECHTASRTPAASNLATEGHLLERSVLLQGERTGINFIHATSLIASERIPTEMLEKLMCTNIPLGLLLRESRLETFREVLGCAYYEAGEFASHFGIAHTSPLVGRTYRILLAGKPIIQITEKFPTTTLREA